MQLYIYYHLQGINPRHHIFRSSNASKRASSDLPSASTLSKEPNCFESASLIEEENYGALQSANISSYQLQDILKLEEFTNNDEADSAVFIANLFKDSVDLVINRSRDGKEQLKHVEFCSKGSRYLVEVRTQLKAAKQHLMPWLCSTTIMPDISLYKLKDTHTQNKSDLPIAIFEVISDTPWQTSRQLAIKLVELLRLFRAYGHDVPELTGVVLPRSISDAVGKTQLPVINESPEKGSNSSIEIAAAAVSKMKISDTRSASQSTPSNRSQSFAVEVKVRFDCEQLKFVISYQPLQSTDVIHAVRNAPLDIEISSHSNSNFLQLSEKELEQIRETLSARKFFGKYEGLNTSVALQQLYSRTALVFKAQTGMEKEIVLKVFAHGDAEYIRFDNYAKELNLQHALLSEGILSLVVSGPLIFVFECLPQLSRSEAKRRIGDVLEAIKLAVDELHSHNVAHLDIRLPNICFKNTSGGNDGLVAVLIDLERAKGEIKSILFESYSSCMYRTWWTLEDIDFLQVYWMALWLLLDDVHVIKVSYHSMDTLEAANLSPECCKKLCNWIKGLESPLPSGHWTQFLLLLK